VLEVGDRFHFAGHLMPTLDSQVAVTVTAPSGAQHLVGGQANTIGYFYEPADDFEVNEAGLWTVDVRVWHDGLCSAGATIPPYPSGDVLGSQGGRYVFYVAPAGASRLALSAPKPGFLEVDETFSPIRIEGAIPGGLTDVSVDYTIAMPGVILERGQASISDGVFSFEYDPKRLHDSFPNLDLAGRDDHGPGLADTIAIGLLLQGAAGTDTRHMATTVTLQGEQVFVMNGRHSYQYLPAIVKGPG
jgi:hypothetical protein